MNISKYIKALPLGLLLLGATLSVVSCSKDKEIFHTDANSRVDERIVALRQQLVGAEHGWIMDYYPQRHLNYGGFVLGMKFDDKDNVLISGEREYDLKGNKLEPVLRSMYNLGSDRSVTLNFSTHNAHLHDFGDPGTHLGDGYSRGFEGDHEFMLLENDNPDVIKLKGKKTQNTIYMRRATEPIASYIDKVRAMRQAMYGTPKLNKDHMEALEGSLGGVKVDLTPNDDNYGYYYLVRKDRKEEINEKLAYVATPQGLRFHKVVEGISELIWNESDKSFSTAKGDKLIARDDPVYPAYSKYLGDYIFSYGNNGQYKFDVTFEEGRRRSYSIKGAKLPFTIIAHYDIENDRFEIRDQTIPGGGKLGVWAYPTATSLSTSEGVGMYAKLVEGSNPAQYIMVDNGKWSAYAARSFVLWGPRGGVVDFPNFPGRIILPKFTRKN